MTKTKSVYFCNNCGNESPKWIGKCPVCGQWNTYVEETVSAKKSGAGPVRLSEMSTTPVKVSEIHANEVPRITLPSGELNRVLGGGLVPGAIILVAGEPGIGKSTLVLQNMLRMRSKKVLYVSGEESAQQIKLRADRIGGQTGECYIVGETSLENIYRHIEGLDPDIVVVDSIQTVASDNIESAAGSVSQVRECAASLLKFAKTTNKPVILIGHINKEGSIAGPKTLEHIVDAVFQFEGDCHYMYRLLRAIKNRFGSTSEIGIYEMNNSGLREVLNPSEMLLSQIYEDLSGTAIGVTVDGIRPFFIEVQALVSTAAYGTPQRSVTGFDGQRMNMLLAVLEKRVGFKLAQKDVFLNIVGGLKVSDPAIDLAVICAILSSNVDMQINKSVCMSGEVGLSGELRHVTRIDARINEAAKLGFKSVIVPKGNTRGLKLNALDINIIEAARVEDAFKYLFG